VTPIPLSLLLGEGARKRRTAYSSGRRELIGYEVPKDIVPRPKRKPPKKKPGRLIARTPFAYKRWRVF
jgi:hypothetical protein